MKFEIESQYDYKGKDAPWGITGFNMYPETRTIERTIGNEIETYWVIELNSLEELLELCKQLKPRVLDDMDIAIRLPRSDDKYHKYPVIRIHDFFFE